MRSGTCVTRSANGTHVCGWQRTLDRHEEHKGLIDAHALVTRLGQRLLHQAHPVSMRVKVVALHEHVVGAHVALQVNRTDLPQLVHKALHLHVW